MQDGCELDKGARSEAVVEVALDGVGTEGEAIEIKKYYKENENLNRKNPVIVAIIPSKNNSIYLNHICFDNFIKNRLEDKDIMKIISAYIVESSEEDLSINISNDQ